MKYETLRFRDGVHITLRCMPALVPSERDPARVFPFPSPPVPCPMYPACSQPPPTVAWLVAPKTKTHRKAAHNARYFSFKFVNTEITIEYAKQRRWSARNSCISGYRYGPTCKARKNRRDYYTAERGQEGEKERERKGGERGEGRKALAHIPPWSSEQPRQMKYSIIRRLYCARVHPRFPPFFPSFNRRPFSTAQKFA